MQLPPTREVTFLILTDKHWPQNYFFLNDTTIEGDLWTYFINTTEKDIINQIY